MLITSGANNGAKTDPKVHQKDTKSTKTLRTKNTEATPRTPDCERESLQGPHAEYEKELLQGPRNAESHSKDPRVRKRVTPRIPECERDSGARKRVTPGTLEFRQREDLSYAPNLVRVENYIVFRGSSTRYLRPWLVISDTRGWGKSQAADNY